ncbi:potassium/sodium hyperpolarization-activated cyclic nucleotide-gated channel 2-like [Heptranchias perlo]|uniref:potassium/sodium hyperpolarization-activated cyclic nucleotide-gated channel 2-like n=1 Tax=Heptranchias perlo TaxID=212740 RepID=UPI00355A3BDF
MQANTSEQKNFECEQRNLCLNTKNSLPNVVLLNPKDIAKQYIKTWFLIDLAAAFPLDSILFLIKAVGFHQFSSYTFSKFLRFLYFGRIVSLIRLLWVSSPMRRFKEWELATDMNLEPIQLLLRAVSVCFIILLVCHWNGCIQFFIPMLQGFPKESWVVKANLTRCHEPREQGVSLIPEEPALAGVQCVEEGREVGLPEDEGIVASTAWWADQYSAGVLRAISHTLGNSYGIGGLPTEFTEIAVTVVSMISGALMHTIMVANVAALVLNADVPGRMYREKLCQVEEYMINRRFPRLLRLKVSNYYRERYHGKWFNQEGIVSEMSEYLREVLNSPENVDTPLPVEEFKRIIHEDAPCVHLTFTSTSSHTDTKWILDVRSQKGQKGLGMKKPCMTPSPALPVAMVLTLSLSMLDVLSYLCRDLVNNVPMFQNGDPNFLKAIITNLHYEIFQKDDVIIREGAVAERMFFIESGIVSVETEFYQKHLSDGAYFGGL